MGFRVDVRPLFSSLSASREVVGEFLLPDVELGDQTYHFDGPVSFEITLTNTGAGIVAEGSATARVVTSCVRCLVDFPLDVTVEVEGFYVLPSKAEDLPEEQEFELIGEDLSVDLEPIIAASLVVDLPYAPVHSEECKGLCSSCGADLNEETCSCAAPAHAHPFDVLRSLDFGDDAES